MANPIAINGTHKRKETYANEILTLCRAETNIYDDFSTDYEKDALTGQILVPTRDGDVQISDYDVKNGIELTQSATDYLVLPIDKNYGVNELIDGYEAEAVPDNIRAQRIESAGYAIGLKKEKDAITELVEGGTTSPDTDALTEANVYKKIATEIKNMKKRNMDKSKMRVAITPDVELLLLTDEKFANTAGTLGEILVREGVIGRINGVPVKTNNIIEEVDEDVDFIVYDTRFCQRYEAWAVEPSINDLADGKHIGASALQGREVGGLMVTNALGVQVRKHASDEPETYTVTFDTDGGSSVEAQEVEAGGHATEPSPAPTKENKTFGGWYKEAELTNEFVFATETINADTTVYAKWTD